MFQVILGIAAWAATYFRVCFSLRSLESDFLHYFDESVNGILFLSYKFVTFRCIPFLGIWVIKRKLALFAYNRP